MREIVGSATDTAKMPMVTQVVVLVGIRESITQSEALSGVDTFAINAELFVNAGRETEAANILMLTLAILLVSGQ